MSAAADASANGRMKVLVKEKIGDSGVELLREHFDVDVGTDWADGELAERIGEYDGILIRSATKMTAELIEQGSRLRVIGRAGVGVDNVDVDAATKRGIVVANAPQSNVVTAAEHTMALLLALARNIPQAHQSLLEGKWDRSKYSGVELYEKTLGIVGFGRIGQLVAQRARGFNMRVLAFDPFVSAERYRELGVEKAADSDEIYAQADFITVHLPKTPETEGWLNAEAFQKMRDGVRVLNVARGGLIDDAALKDALDSGKVAGAALDVFPSEPMTDYPLFDGYPNVVVTPHLGASTAEATDRAGYQSAEQIVAALTGGVVSTAVNIPSIGAEDMQVLGPFLPMARQLGRLAMALAEGSSVERIEAAFMGRIAEFDTRLLTLAVIGGALQGRTEEQVNPVNAPSIAEERGIVVEEKVRLRGAGLQRADPRHRRRRRRSRGRRRHRNRPQAGAAPRRGAGPAPDDRARAPRDRVSLRRPARHDRPRRHDLRLARHQHLLGRRRALARWRDGGDDAERVSGWPRWSSRPTPPSRTRSCRRSSPPRASSTAGRSTSAEWDRALQH